MTKNSGVSTLHPFTFYLDWIICAQFAGQCWAKEKGLYTAAGLDVTLQPWQEQDGRSLLDKVLSGGVCAGCCEDNLIVSAVSKKQPIKAIGAMLKHTPLVLMSRPAQRIRSIQDLRGKRIGIHSDGNRALEMVLALEGISKDTLQIHEVGFDLDHLRLDRFDALQGYVMTEPVQLAALGVDVDVLPIQHARLLPFAQTYFAANAVIETSGAVLAQFLAASNAGWRAVLAQPDEAAHVIARMLGDLSQVAEQRAMLARVLPLVAGGLPESEIGNIPVEQWQRNLATYFEFGLIEQSLTVADVIAIV